ncbi:hypothetical protein K504DRAFT_449595 [Pleomassaria siparia CBS 279.74]|uniref:Secreted protein n=1 Tax=Pleomassaria siparia CBS 279.74 TaxID=1314801 RepID=A0A6G1JVN7_9PLEO|nr:hypothetical protein K504DRAFT_449595 [Pleomassaria siparia CBS 279.74]
MACVRVCVCACALCVCVCVCVCVCAVCGWACHVERERSQGPVCVPLKEIKRRRGTLVGKKQGVNRPQDDACSMWQSRTGQPPPITIGYISPGVMQGQPVRQTDRQTDRQVDRYTYYSSSETSPAQAHTGSVGMQATLA